MQKTIEFQRMEENRLFFGLIARPKITKLMDY